MTFIQLISFRTDHYDQFLALEQDWLDATEGRRTLLREQRLIDRTDPRHHVHINEFESYESAMENSHLPETDALARRLASLTEGAEFGDYEVEEESDVRRQLAAVLRHDMTASLLSDVYADDVEFVGLWPQQVVRGRGPAFIDAALRADAPARTFERWEVTVSESGFVAEYAYRTPAPAAELSIGVIVVTVDRTRIARLLVTCGGAWDAAAEARILGASAATGALV